MPRDKVTLNNTIFVPVIGEYLINIYKILINIKVIDIIIAIFFNGPITIKGTKYTYFIKYEIIIILFKFIINIGNYKAEVISPKINNIIINNVIFETAFL